MVIMMTVYKMSPIVIIVLSDKRTMAHQRHDTITILLLIIVVTTSYAVPGVKPANDKDCINLINYKHCNHYYNVRNSCDRVDKERAVIRDVEQ